METFNDKRKLSQTAYSEQMLSELHSEIITRFHVPMVADIYTELKEHEKDEIIQESHYRTVIGSLAFFGNRTHPDICTAVGIFAHYVNRPTHYLIECVYLIFGYFDYTKGYGLIQTRKRNLNVRFYSDPDFGGCMSSRRSRTGWVAIFTDTAVSWSSHKQNSVDLSSSEAEYIAMSEICRELKYIYSFLAEIGGVVNCPTPLFSDNVAARCWVESTKLLRRSTNIDIR